MRKKVVSIFVLAVIFLSVMSVGSVFAAGETATATNMQIAEGKAAEIDTLVTVLWAYWMDELNAYNLHPDTEDPPQWTEDFNDLTDLPDTFPVEDYELHINGNNIDIHTTISEGLVEYLRVLLPTAAISDTGDVVLTVVRPRAYLGSSIFVKRDGTTEDGGPTFMPNHTISFGQDIELRFEGDTLFNVASGAALSFNGGSLVDIGSLGYRGEEIDIRFLNRTGDTMTGDFTLLGDFIYRGQEIDDRFINIAGDSVPGDINFTGTVSYKNTEIDNRYVNRSGDVMTGRLTLESDLGIKGVYIQKYQSGLNVTGPLYVSGKSVWHTGNDGSGSGMNADLLDGKDASAFALAGHTHPNSGSGFSVGTLIMAAWVPPGSYTYSKATLANNAIVSGAHLRRVRIDYKRSYYYHRDDGSVDQSITYTTPIYTGATLPGTWKNVTGTTLEYGRISSYGHTTVNIYAAVGLFERIY